MGSCRGEVPYVQQNTRERGGTLPPEQAGTLLLLRMWQRCTDVASYASLSLLMLGSGPLPVRPLHGMGRPPRDAIQGRGAKRSVAGGSAQGTRGGHSRTSKAGVCWRASKRSGSSVHSLRQQTRGRDGVRSQGAHPAVSPSWGSAHCALPCDRGAQRATPMQPHAHADMIDSKGLTGQRHPPTR